MRLPLTSKPFLLVAAFTLIGFASASFSLAQDAASAPFRQPSPPIPESTATPPPEQPATATPAPSPKPEKKSTVEEEGGSSPTPAAKRAATPKSVQRDVTETSARQDSIAGTIKRLEKEWESAIVKHDIPAIQKLIADDFVGVSSNGKRGDKMTMVYEARRDKNVYKSSATKKMFVHSFEPHVAVVMGITRKTGTTADGRPFDHSYRFTDEWVERGGKWQCVGARATAMPKR